MTSFEDTQRLAQTMVRKGLTRQKKEKNEPQSLRGRFFFLMMVLMLLPASVLVRAAYIQVLSSDFLRHQGDLRSHRLSKIDAPRGSITDRNGEEIAISIPVDSLWVDPSQVLNALDKHPKLFHSEGWKQLAKLVGMRAAVLSEWVTTRGKKRFVYLKRRLKPQQANLVKALKLPGIHLLPESIRFYPAGEVTAQLVGFTNIDGKGIEGIELAFDDVLRGEAGKVVVKRDLLGNVIARSQVIKAPQ